MKKGFPLLIICIVLFFSVSCSWFEVSVTYNGGNPTLEISVDGEKLSGSEVNLLADDTYVVSAGWSDGSSGSFSFVKNSSTGDPGNISLSAIENSSVSVTIALNSAENSGTAALDIMDETGTNVLKTITINITRSVFANVDDSFFSEAPYLDILAGEIVNTSARMDYSQDGGLTWSPCEGSIVSLTLAVNDHILVRDSSDTTIVRDLGTVEALSGRADLIAGDELYIGNGTWNDDLTGAPGSLFNIFAYVTNIGDTSSGAQTIKFYLSSDTAIDPATDTLLLSHSYGYSTPYVGDPAHPDDDSWFIDCRNTDITVPDVEPGTYYVAAVVDSADSVSELNEENNVTAPENMAVMHISSDEAVTDGAMKIVNSWGTGSWQNVTGDGHYWMPYDTMKANKMPVYFYANDFNSEYVPTVIATFKITHPIRDEVKISIGLGDPDSPVAEKYFESRDYNGNPLGGPITFPDNVMVLDISEFAYAINDYDLYMEIENTGTTTGTLDSFGVEFYNDYPNPSGLTTTSINSAGNGSFSGGTNIAWVSTKDSLSVSDLISITPLSKSTYDSTSFSFEQPGADELAKDKEIIGVYEEGKNYNVLYDGKYGTGYQPPREDDWANMVKLRSIDSDLTRATYNGSILANEVDNSETIYFPPVGNQGGKGSCSAFSVGYYIQTYTEAKEHGWDLSGVTWGTDSSGNSEAGAPSGSLDKIFSPDFLYNQINGGEDNGSYIGYAAELAIRQGGATWENMPYRNLWNNMTPDYYTYWGSEDAWRDAPLYRGDESGNFYWTNNQSGYFIIESDEDIQLLKSLLSLGYIVSTAIPAATVYDSLDSKDVVSKTLTWTSTDHAQTIVGYKEGSAWDASNPED